ncbi:MAG: 50S ribosomal protein L3 [Parcubacteria group bacterium QH_9_35_7]|nr:MAG: 50S ribosomal protein L3 [Parcubacteria group bacterium QH_9_35_7]
MKFLLGEKLDMTQVFKEDGEVVPVTRVQAGPCVVTQVKDGSVNDNEVNAVQIGFGDQKKWRLNKAQQQHLEDLDPVKVMRDFRIEPDHELKRGDVLDVNIFEEGEKVNVRGTTKGQGFQGVVKRHNFAGAPATHGTKDQHRMPGSAGATGPAKVFKNKKMPGRMGSKKTTIQNLEIVKIKPEEEELLIKGGLPGSRGNLLRIFTEEGKIELERESDSEEKAEQEDEDQEEKEDKQQKEEDTQKE